MNDHASPHPAIEDVRRPGPTVVVGPAGRADKLAHSSVRLADRTLPLATVRREAATLSRLFARARAEIGHAWCLCSDPPLRLVIRVRDGRYHVAGWPGEGEGHRVGCAFHKEPGELSGRSHYALAAISEDEDGTRIRLQAALETRSAPPPVVCADPDSSTAESRSRRAVGLLGLLHWLWEQAGLHRWHPGHGSGRRWSDCQALLAEQLIDCQVNGHPLADLLYVVPPFQPAEAERIAAGLEAFRARLGQSGRRGQRGLILGELKDLRDSPHGRRVSLRHLASPLFATTSLLERARRSYRSALSPGRDPSTRTMVLALVERSRGGYLVVVDLAAMLASRSFVPADSSFELQLADRLVAARRAFIKPLRYEGQEVFPDFVLTDVEPACYVEVWGMPGREDYERRKRDKQAYYRRADIPVLEWVVTDSIPDLRHPTSEKTAELPDPLISRRPVSTSPSRPATTTQGH